jgi:hypothetical protein
VQAHLNPCKILAKGLSSFFLVTDYQQRKRLSARMLLSVRMRLSAIGRKKFVGPGGIPRRKRLSAIGKNKSVGPHGIRGKILKLGGEVMIPYLAR